MKIRTLIIATALASCLWLQACAVPAWVNDAENIAKTIVPIAGSIVDIVDPALAPAVTIAEGAFQALVKALDDYKAQPNATTLQAVQSAFTAVNDNVAALVTAAQVKDSTTKAQVIGIVGLLDQAVAELAALVPPAAAAQVSVRATATAPALGWKAGDFKRAYNDIVKGDPRFKKL